MSALNDGSTTCKLRRANLLGQGEDCEREGNVDVQIEPYVVDEFAQVPADDRSDRVCGDAHDESRGVRSSEMHESGLQERGRSLRLKTARDQTKMSRAINVEYPDMRKCYYSAKEDRRASGGRTPDRAMAQAR